MRRCTPLLVVFVLLAPAAGSAAITAGGRAPLERFAQRPQAQAGVDGSWSYLQTQGPVAWPANAANWLEFDYRVESEPGHDELEVYRVDAQNVPTLLWNVSGLRGGRMRLKLPSAGGAMRIRFRYVKDGSGSRFLDTAWIDNVAFRSSKGGVLGLHTFDQWILGVPAGWTSLSSGFAGPWTVSQPLRPQSASRPPAQAGKANSTSSFERLVFLPSLKGNYVSFDYFVDSRPGVDFMRVYVDPQVNPAPVFAVSGRNRAGHTLIDAIEGKAIAGGPHLLRFEYAKGGGGGIGLDTARVDNVVVMSNGSPVELHTFEGRYPGAVPIRVGSGPGEWTGAGVSGGWVVLPGLPHKSYVPQQKVGEESLPGAAPYAEPVVDGEITGSEYRNATAVRIRNRVAADAEPGEFRLVSSASAGALHLGMRVKGGTAAPGAESGTLTVYLDAGHTATLKGQGCGKYGQLPGSEDRKLSFAYSIGSGPGARFGPVKQEKGTCSAWAELARHDAATWPVTMAASEPLDDPGFVHLEVKVVVPPEYLAEGRLGVGVRRANSAGAASLERLPYSDQASWPADDDVFTWETVNLTYMHATQELTDQPFDGCCFPEPSRPGVSW